MVRTCRICLLSAKEPVVEPVWSKDSRSEIAKVTRKRVYDRQYITHVRQKFIQVQWRTTLRDISAVRSMAAFPRPPIIWNARKTFSSVRIELFESKLSSVGHNSLQCCETCLLAKYVLRWRRCILMHWYWRSPIQIRMWAFDRRYALFLTSRPGGNSWRGVRGALNKSAYQYLYMKAETIIYTALGW